MRVRLVDMDNAVENLALMKISAYHKKQGDKVGFTTKNPDLVYVSAIFAENAGSVLEEFEGIETIKGGSGIDLNKRLPDEIEYIKPDYDLYGLDYSLGFTTRGCNRNCPFCIVPEKEGEFHIHQHPKEFHDERFDKIKLYDNNILFGKDWFFEATDWILENNLKVDFDQGLDIRLLDEEIAERIAELDFFKTIKFAWDWPHIERKVREGITLLREAGVDLRHNVQFYVLVNFNTTYEEDLYRCRKLKEWGTNPFVMLYDGGDTFTKKLARWANKKWIFWSCDFEDYTRLSRLQRLKVEEFV